MDVFPSTFSKTIERIEWANTTTIIPFIARILPHSTHLIYETISKCNKIVANIERCLTASQKRNPYSGKYLIPWGIIYHKMTKQFNERGKNTDSRIHFYDGHNKFLTKAFFTFGLRKTEDEYHVIETMDAPILVYIANLDGSLIFREKSFRPAEQNCFDVYILEQNKIYAIPPNTIYILLTVQKTLFGFHRMFMKDMNGIMIENWPNQPAKLPFKSTFMRNVNQDISPSDKLPSEQQQLEEFILPNDAPEQISFENIEPTFFFLEPSSSSSSVSMVQEQQQPSSSSVSMVQEQQQQSSVSMVQEQQQPSSSSVSMVQEQQQPSLTLSSFVIQPNLTFLSSFHQISPKWFKPILSENVKFNTPEQNQPMDLSSSSFQGELNPEWQHYLCPELYD